MNNKFVKDSLLPDEKILATAKFHPIKNWILPILPALFSAMGIVAIVGSLFSPNCDLGCVMSNIVYTLGGIVLTFALYKLNKWINSKDEFVITNKRVVAKVGVIRRVAFELHNEQMESIEIRQGIVGRILNFGTLMPCGIGASKVRIRLVVNPFEFRQHFYDLKKNMESTPKVKSATPKEDKGGVQKYFAQPQSDGKFHVVERNSITGEFVSIQGEVYNTEFEARKRAKELNVEYNTL